MVATTCAHYEVLPWSKLDPEDADSPLLIKLKPDCLFIGCGRDDKRHALEHYRQRHKPNEKKYHGVVLDIQALQCWCYDCDDVICPPIFSNLESDDNDTISSLTSTTTRRKSSRTSLLQFPTGVVGLYNLGNSCYMNAAIQALLNWQVISPSRLVREVKLVNPMFHGYTQQDTMDFVRCIFERIHDEMRVQIVQPSSNNTHKITESPDSSHRRKSERLARQDGGKRQCPSNKSKGFPQYRSIVSDVFGGTLRSEIRCLECDNVSVKDDPFYDVSVQICATPEGPKGTKSSFGYIGNLFSSIGESFGINGKPVKLETCLGAFSAPEILDGKDRYKCEKCNRLVDSKKTLKFKELSQILCIQLKRFRHESYFSSKIGTHVVFPIDSLDMRPFLHEDASEKTKKETRYYLSSIITHRGSFGSGHYIAYCRHLGTNQWLEFDDSSVTVVSEEEISKVQVYAMFYSLVDWNSRKEREEWAPKITEAVPEKDKGVYISQLWYNRWCTMSDPGPMDNSEIICPHGSLLPEKLVNAVELVQYVSNDVYEYFVKRHGESSGVPPLQDAVECERCMEEDRQLDIRRKREEKDISALDTSTLKAGEHWYLIASEWLVQWGQFKSGDGLPPGPISNESLMGENGPLPDLIRGLHYRGVNRRVWDYFHRAYGGGPIIMRRSINIYGPSPEPVGRDNESGDDVYVDVVGQ